MNHAKRIAVVGLLALLLAGCKGNKSAQGPGEKAAYDVVLESAGTKKDDVVNIVRLQTGLGPRQAQDLVESAPVTIRQAVPKDQAEVMKKQLEAAGATVTLK